MFGTTVNLDSKLGEDDDEKDLKDAHETWKWFGSEFDDEELFKFLDKAIKPLPEDEYIPLDKSFFNQEIVFDTDEENSMQIMTKFMNKTDDAARNDNIIKVELVGHHSGNDEGQLEFQVREFLAKQDTDFVSIKPKFTEIKGKQQAYYYAIFDLCHIDEKSEIQIRVKNNGSRFTGTISAAVESVETFKVICTDEKSEIFKPRQEHAACNTYDQKLWVFGGRNYVGDEEKFLNDIVYYDEMFNMWRSIEVKGPQPKGRYGHVMFCYYDYLIVYGGQGQGHTVFGDLWVFDIIKEDWHLIMDSNNIHALQH